MALPSNASTLNEAQARYVLIDPALEEAGWNLNDRTQVGLEVPVDGYDAEPWNGVTDYCLFDPSGDVLAVVEAKRTCRSPREGEEQLRHYLAEIAKRQSFVPFGFMTNGLNWHFWDYGNANPRLVAALQHERASASEREALRQADHPLQTLLHQAFSAHM